MKHHLSLPVLFSAVVCLNACSTISNLTGSPASAPAPMVNAPAAQYRASATPQRVLVKTGSIRITAKDVTQCLTAVKKHTKSAGGYIEDSDLSSEDRARANVDIRVPEAKLTQLMDEIARLGTVTSRDIEVEDVTEEWIDMNAKLKNMRALRDRLRKLLDRAQTVKDVLSIEKELARVQGELDSLEGQLKAMRTNVRYSRLSVNIQSKSIPGPIGAVGKGAWWGIRKLFVIR